MAENGGEISAREFSDQKELPELPSIDGLIAKLTTDRDAAIDESRGLRTQIAMYKAAAEGDKSRISELESRGHSMMLARDEAVRKYLELFGLFKTIKATLYAFDVPFPPDKIDEAERAVDTQNAMARQQIAQQQQITPAGLDPRWLNVGERTNLSKPSGSS